MRREELGLGLPAVATLAVPVGGALAVERAGAGDGDAGSGDGDEGALPLLVRKGRRARESDGRAGLEPGQVERATSRDREAADRDRGAARDRWVIAGWLSP